MEPVTMIVLALAAGVSAGLKPTAEQAIKDAYAGVKTLIQQKYTGVDLSPLERKPESESKRESVREDLAEAGAGQDQELLDRVKALLDEIEKRAPEAASAIGVDLKDVRAAALKIQKVDAEGAGVKVENGEFTGDIDISDIRAGKSKNPENPQ
jgi:hypothetical protein